MLKKDRHHVHLSADIDTAIKVGKRHGNPVVFEVLAEQMFADKHSFYLSDNGVWLTDHVPVDFLRQLSNIKEAYFIEGTRRYQYRVDCELGVRPEEFVGVKEELEVSMPCVNCRRDYKTIIFRDIHKKGICTPSNKCSGFAGDLSGHEIIKKQDNIALKYLIDFDYTPFIDKKYNHEATLPTRGWARVYFTLKCSKCQKEITISTQENRVRPWQEVCNCGNVLYREEKSPFGYIVVPIN